MDIIFSFETFKLFESSFIDASRSVLSISAADFSCLKISSLEFKDFSASFKLKLIINNN